MSPSIDNRVVSMQFDNKNFESNVKTSLGTLEKLKQSLNLKGAAKGLDSLSSSAKKVDMSPIGKAAETVGLKFNAMYTMADQALRNITNSAMLAGKRIVSALTIDPVKTGFSEYETKIGSIQTIMSNTASKGTTMDDVTRVIDELNTYADKTIYNFAEMTRNIGTFTAAGVGLEDSAAAIQGIANLAAASGSSSQQASTAMYQLSQALAAGTVKLMDWNSVVNAGMGGEKFQEALKATARDHGVAVDDMIKKNGSFRESLQDGWITADILNETLNKFTVDGATKYANSMMESGKWTKEQADALIKEAQAMEDAATKVKTFTQLWDTMKESAQSGWGKTWELIVGDFDQAKELWTGVSDVLGGIINDSSDARNSVLEGALTSNWDKMVKKINEAGVETSEFEKAVKKVAIENNVPIDQLIKKYGSFEKAVRSGSISANILKEALTRLTKAEVDLSGVGKNLKKGSTGDDVKKIQTALDKLGFSLGKFGVDGKFGKITQQAVKDFQKLKGLKVTGIVDDATLKALKEATDKSAKFKESIDELVDGFRDLGGRELLIESFKNLFNSLVAIIKPVKEAFRDIFPPTTSEELYNLIDGFHKLTERFRDFLKSTDGQNLLENLGSTFKGLFSVVDIGLMVFKEFGKGAIKLFGSLAGFSGGFLEITGNIGDWLTNFRDWVKETGVVTAAVELMTKAIQNGVAKIKQFGSYLKDKFVTFLESDNSFAEYFNGGIKIIQDFINKLKNLDSLSLEDVGNIFLEFGQNIVDHFKSIDFEAVMSGIRDGLKNFRDDAATYLEGIGDKFGGVIGKIRDFFLAVKNYLGDNLGGILAIGALAGLFFILKKIYDLLSKFAKPLDFLDDLGEGLQKLGKALTFSVKATAVKNIAISIGILAASLAVLAMIPWEKLKYALAAMAVVIAGLVGVIWAIGKFMTTDKLGDMAKLSGFILGLSGSLLIFAIAAKTISRLDGEALGKTALVITGFVIIVKAISKAMSLVGTADIAAFGLMMLGLSKALLILSIAIGILGHMDTGTLLKGGAAVGVFLMMMAGMMKASRVLEKDIPKFAGSMIGLSIALLFMTMAVKSLGKLDAETLIQGVVGVGVFLMMMAGIMKSSSAINKDIPKFAAAMAGLSFGLISMATAVKILAGIEEGDLIKGGLVMGAFLLMFKSMMKATQMLTKNSANAAKIGAMILSFAGAMVLLTGVIAILAKIKLGDLAKAIGAIAAVAIVFGGLIALTKFAKVGKGVKVTILAMAGAIGILAIAVAALSLIDGTKLAGATAALSSIIAVFALLTASTKFIGTKIVGKLLVMVGVVALLGYILKELSSLPGNVLGVATGLALVIASLSASLVLLGAAGSIGAPALATGILAFGALAALVGIIAGIAVASLPAIGKKLSEFMTNLEPFLEASKNITPETANGLKTLGEALAIFTGVGFVNAITFGGASKGLKNFGKDLIPLAKGLVEFNNAVSGDDFDVTKIKAAAQAASELAGVSVTVSDSYGLLDWIAKMSGKESDFATFGKDLIPVANGLSEFNKAVTGEDFNAEKIKAAAQAASELAGISVTVSDGNGLLDWIAKLTGKESAFASFGKDLIPVANGLVEFNKSVTGEDFDAKKLKAAAEAASELAGISVSVTEATGLLDWIAKLNGKDSDFASFGKDLIPVANGLVEFNKAVTGEDFDAKKLKAAAEAAASLAETSVSVTEATGLLDWIAKLTGKESTFASFGKDLIPVANGLVEFNKAVAGDDFDAKKIKAAAQAASELAGVQVAINESTGLLDFIAKLKGKESDFASFGKDLIPVANGLSAFNAAVTGDDFDVKKIKAAAEAAAGPRSLSVLYPFFSGSTGRIHAGQCAGTAYLGAESMV